MSEATIMNDLDLEPIIVKSMDPEEGCGWSLELTQRIALEYRRYLVLCLDNPDAAIIPSSYVDDMWHLHILDTLKYQEDCNNIFGYFLHHFPYFGMRGEQDAVNLKNAWEQTISLYENRFGSVPSDLWPRSKRCPNCGRRCRDGRSGMSEERPRLAQIC